MYKNAKDNKNHQERAEVFCDPLKFANSEMFLIGAWFTKGFHPSDK